MKKLLIGLPLILAMITTTALAQPRSRGGYGGGGYSHAPGAGREAPAFARPNAARGFGGPAFGGGGPRFGGGGQFGGGQFGGGGRRFPGGAYGGRGYGPLPPAPAYGRGGFPGGRFADPGFRGAPAFAAAPRPGPGPGFGRGGGFRGFTRGQTLPPAYWGSEVADPRVYHLRRPPNGYGWVTVGQTAYLAQRSTGLILDTAPLY